MKQKISDSKFGTFEKDTLWEKIAIRLLSLLKEKQLHPGDQLPPERELAAMMQVSRPSLREALRALSMMNVLEIRPGAGTFVSSLEPELLVEHLDFIISLDDSTYIKLFEARKILEVGIIALAAKRITDEELAELDEILEESQEALGDSAAFLQADLELHKNITKAAQNPILNRIADSIGKLALASRSRTVGIPGIQTETIEHHRAIVAALKAHDAEAAQQAMLQHLNNVEQRLEQLASTTVNADGALSNDASPLVLKETLGEVIGT
jgi:GntR family transcriptional repressor for pyruvate dehydrogenase complex